MTSRLVEEGWVAPEHPGPSRRVWILLVVGAVVATGSWAAWLATSVNPVGGDRRDVTLDLAKLAARGEVRTSRGSRFVVVRRTLDPGHRVAVTTTTPAGLDARAVAIRVDSDGARITTATTDRGAPLVRIDPRRGAPIRLLVVFPADRVSDAATIGRLSSVTRAFDRKRAAGDASRRLADRLRGALPWIVVLGPLLCAVAPLLLWRRGRRRTFNLRVPGPGKAIGAEPPSSLDPVGVAVLAAGARDVDIADAFAGHVLDLVERRQIRMRRMGAADDGRSGVVLGLAGVEEGVVADDPAIAVLRSVVDPEGDGTSVLLPEGGTAGTVASRSERIGWGVHVDERARFERMTVDGGAARVRLATEVLGAGAVIAVVEAVRAGDAAHAALAWLVAALATPAALACIAWSRDARHWRVVARARRVERAQWRAWRAALGTSDGPQLDQRSLPLLVAAGGRPELVRSTASTASVALDAVTAATIAALRGVVSSPHAP